MTSQQSIPHYRKTASIQTFRIADATGQRIQKYSSTFSSVNTMKSSNLSQYTEKLFRNKSSCVQQTQKNIRIVVSILLFKLTDENVGERKLTYNDPYDFEDAMIAFQAQERHPLPLCCSSSPMQFNEPEVLQRARSRGTNTAAN
jgi:hypothetical protein